MCEEIKKYSNDEIFNSNYYFHIAVYVYIFSPVHLFVHACIEIIR
jgi:hypothetical protein